jgi:hypothetical protein
MSCEGGQERLRAGAVEDDDEEEIEYWFCRSRQATSFQYRGSSSLSPAQVMEHEVYYLFAEDALERGTLMAHLLVVILGIYNQLRAKIVRWIGYDVITAAVNARIVQIKSMMQQLILLITWTRAYGEMALLYAEDLTVFIRQRHRVNAPEYSSH